MLLAVRRTQQREGREVGQVHAVEEDERGLETAVGEEDRVTGELGQGRDRHGVSFADPSMVPRAPSVAQPRSRPVGRSVPAKGLETDRWSGDTGHLALEREQFEVREW